VQAAMGLLQLNYLEQNIAKRQQIARCYRTELSGVEGISFLEDLPEVRHNYAYFPILVDETRYRTNRDELYETLKKHNIYARRYFYPLISQFAMYNGLESAQRWNLPIAEAIAAKVICLPIFPEMEENVVERVVNIIKKNG